MIQSQKYPPNTEGFHTIGDVVTQKYGIKKPIAHFIDGLKGKK